MTVRDEFQQMTPDQIEWYVKGYDVAKSESVDVEQLQQQVAKILGDYVEFIQDVQEQWDEGKPIKFGDNFKKFDATVAAVVGLLKGETE